MSVTSLRVIRITALLTFGGGLKTVFNQRRKMLRVSLRQIFNAVKPTDGFYEQDIMTKRPEQLSIAQFVELTNMVEEQLKIIGQ